jgi:DNA repair exonuclease SbcCD ATPase subunit
MMLHLSNTVIKINRLLSRYDINLDIQKFVINDKEFRIPYTKNGITVSDVVYASQGETSFISLALSFALSSESIDKYNILLLDEIDATLDTTNRRIFLTILERQLDDIDAEQVFMITHNNMFDNYPVDLIITGETEIDNYRNMNIIAKF